MTKRQLGLVVILIAACGGSDEASVDAASSDAASGDGPSADAAPGGICGGFAGAECETNEYCDYDSNDCSATDGIGTCRPRPIGCPDPIFQPTCACDGQVYGQPCEAYAAGVDLNVGGCPVEPGRFACGWTQCTITGEYCEHQVSDVASQPDDFQCIALPACQVTPSCACLDGLPCSDWCTGTGQTGLTVTCPGG